VIYDKLALLKCNELAYKRILESFQVPKEMLGSRSSMAPSGVAMSLSTQTQEWKMPENTETAAVETTQPEPKEETRGSVGAQIEKTQAIIKKMQAALITAQAPDVDACKAQEKVIKDLYNTVYFYSSDETNAEVEKYHGEFLQRRIEVEAHREELIAKAREAAANELKIAQQQFDAHEKRIRDKFKKDRQAYLEVGQVKVDAEKAKLDDLWAEHKSKHADAIKQIHLMKVKLDDLKEEENLIIEDQRKSNREAALKAKEEQSQEAQA
jgi:hypothetical protein